MIFESSVTITIVKPSECLLLSGSSIYRDFTVNIQYRSDKTFKQVVWHMSDHFASKARSQDVILFQNTPVLFIGSNIYFNQHQLYQTCIMERPFNFIKCGGMLWFLLKQYSDPQFDEQIIVVKLMTKKKIQFFSLPYSIIFFLIDSQVKL